MIKILDYGVGNIQAYLNIYKYIGISIETAQNEKDLFNETKIILPGVGHFDYAMDKFTKSGLRSITTKLVIDEEIPVLGVCVGFQMMTKSSEEGKIKGLNWINADVKKFNISKDFVLPHMGWNTIKIKKESKLLDMIDNDSRFYFLHSFYIDSHDSKQNLTDSFYDINFTSSIENKNIYGVQFHPEKSHESGIKLLQNFGNL